MLVSPLPCGLEPLTPAQAWRPASPVVSTSVGFIQICLFDDGERLLTWIYILYYRYSE